MTTTEAVLKKSVRVLKIVEFVLYVAECALFSLAYSEKDRIGTDWLFMAVAFGNCLLISGYGLTMYVRAQVEQLLRG